MREFLYKLKWGKYHPQAFAKFAELQRHEHLPLEQLMAMQEAARQQIVSAAYNNTALYRQHYSACGFELGDMKQAGWFEKLPMVTKQHLRKHFEAMTDPRLKAFRSISTTEGARERLRRQVMTDAPMKKSIPGACRVGLASIRGTITPTFGAIYAPAELPNSRMRQFGGRHAMSNLTRVSSPKTRWKNSCAHAAVSSPSSYRAMSALWCSSQNMSITVERPDITPAPLSRLPFRA